MAVPCPRGVKRVPSPGAAKPHSRLSSTGRQPSTRNVVSMDRSEPLRVVESLEETLSSAILADDAGLDEIVHEIDQISNTLKAKDSDAQTLAKALQRAVLCAVKQALVDRELRSLALTDDLT